MRERSGGTSKKTKYREKKEKNLGEEERKGKIRGARGRGSRKKGKIGQSEAKERER